MRGFDKRGKGGSSRGTVGEEDGDAANEAGVGIACCSFPAHDEEGRKMIYSCAHKIKPSKSSS